MLNAIKELVTVNGVSGNEKAVTDYIKSQITPYADKVYTDVMGNLVAVKRGGGKKILVMAHTDEIGIVATFVDENGFVRVSAVGGVNPVNFLNCAVTFENGVRGVFTTTKKENIKMTDCYVDIGVDSRERALLTIDLGMTARFDGDTFETGDMIVSKCLDDRVGCYVLMETIKRMSDTENEIYFVFTSQEEVGLRGARVCGFDISPDVAIAVDVTVAFDSPDMEGYGSKLGGGAAIKVRDNSVICSKPIIESMEAVAFRNGIPYQRDVLSYGGTDVGAVQTNGRGAYTGGISVPIRNVHTTCEMAHKNDITAAVNLLTAFVQKNIENEI